MGEGVGKQGIRAGAGTCERWCTKRCFLRCINGSHVWLVRGTSNSRSLDPRETDFNGERMNG
jgi:hypothetical protein